MDPDLVRQQEEAEREALAALAKKGAALTAAPAALKPQMAALRAATEPPPVLHSIAAAPAAMPPKASEGRRFFAGAARFLSVCLSGAMLGGALGNTAMMVFELPASGAQTIIFGAAGGFALICGLVSLARSGR